MSIAIEIAGKGRILRIEKGLVVFAPNNTSYEHHVDASASVHVAHTPPTGKHVLAVIKVKARKVYSVMSGGNFVQPILGSPRIIQGRVKSLDANSLVVQAGAVFHVELPTGDDTIDLHNGDIQVGSLVNVVAFPGATLDIAK
jgi:hypothetical protein